MTQVLKIRFGLLLIIGLTASVKGQKYDYSKFRFPEVKIPNLVGSVLLNSNNTERLRTPNSLNDENNRGFDYSVYLDYNLYKNGSLLQKNTRYRLINSLNYLFDNSDVDRQFQLGLANMVVHRRYAKGGTHKLLGLQGLFMEVDRNIAIIYDDVFQKRATESGSAQSLNISGTLPIKLGFGRIEPLHDLLLAEFVMDDLLDAGLIEEKFSTEKLFELAKFMSQIRINRSYSWMTQMTQLSEWLKRNDVPDNISSFCLLNNNWQYAFSNDRSYGKRLSAGLIPWIDYAHSSDSSAIGNFRNYGIGLQLEYNYAKALSKYYQTDFTLTLTQSTQKLVNDKFNQISSFQTSYRGAYNPNSRTTLELSMSGDYHFINFKEHNVVLGLVFSLSYFINNKASINGSLGANYSVLKSETFFYRNDLINNISTVYEPYGEIPSFNSKVYSGDLFKLFSNITVNYAF